MKDFDRDMYLNPPSDHLKRIYDNKHHMSVDVGDHDMDKTYITQVVKKSVKLPKVWADVTINERILKESSSSKNIDEQKQLLDHCKHQIVHNIVGKLIEIGIVRIENKTESILAKQKQMMPLTGEDKKIIEDYRLRGEITITGYLDLNDEQGGYSYEDFNSPSKIDPLFNKKIDKEDADFLWKLLPPRINGISDDKHPLQPGWMGCLPREKDKYTIERVKRILNK